MECHGFESHLRQLIFSRKSDCLGCAVLLCLVCLFDLACFILSSFSSLIKNMYIQHIYNVNMYIVSGGSKGVQCHSLADMIPRKNSSK